MFNVLIIVTACLRNDPADCITKTEYFNGSLMQCSLYGQQAANELVLSSHPKRRLTKYKCTIEPVLNGENHV